MTNDGTHPASVTVVIPTRNRWPWVAEAIDSALNQSHPHTQVIVVDDASSDYTVEYVNARYGSQVHLIQNPHRQQKSRSRNTGILAATTEFICMLDSDDILLPESVADRLKPFQEDPTFNGITYGVGQRGRKKRDPDATHFPSGKILARYLSDLTILDNNAFLLKRNQMMKWGMYHPELTNREDREMLLRLASRLPFQFCGTVTHRIRKVDHSASQQHQDILRQDQTFTSVLREDATLIRQLGSGIRSLEYQEDRERARSLFKLRRYREYVDQTKKMLHTYPDIMRTNKRFRRRMFVAHALKAFQSRTQGNT